MPRTFGSLILLRHGQSTANAEGLFTGLLDVPLTDDGAVEAHRATSLLNAARLRPDVMFSSVLVRARQTTEIVTADLRRLPGEVVFDWRLDERNYGALTGLSKRDVLRDFGQAQFLDWRRSVDVAPPPMSSALHEQFLASALFRSLPAEALTRTESLRDVIKRVDAFYTDRVVPCLLEGLMVLVTAHGNSLRALCTILDHLDDDAVRELNIPTGHPLLYEFDEDLQPAAFGGRYLDSVGARASAAELTREGGT